MFPQGRQGDDRVEVERAQLWAQRRHPLVPEPSLAPAPGALQTQADPLLSEPTLHTPWLSCLQSQRPGPCTDPFPRPAGSPGVACGVPGPRGPLPSDGSRAGPTGCHHPTLVLSKPLLVSEPGTSDMFSQHWLISKGKPGTSGKVPCLSPPPAALCLLLAGRSVCEVDLGWLFSNNWAEKLTRSEQDQPESLAASLSHGRFQRGFGAKGVSRTRVSRVTFIMGRAGPHQLSKGH